MAQGKTPMKQDVLVIAPNLQSAPDENAYMTVVGDAIKFDPAEVARRLRGYTLDLPADLVEKYQAASRPCSRPPIVTAAISPTSAKKPIAPPTPGRSRGRADVMKQVSPASTALRQASLDSDPPRRRPQTGTPRTSGRATSPTCRRSSRQRGTGRRHSDGPATRTSSPDTVGTAASGGRQVGRRRRRGDHASDAASAPQCHTARRERHGRRDLQNQRLELGFVGFDRFKNC